MQNTKEILIADSSYHIYNRANGSEKIFLTAENYRFFLQKYQEHISPVADTFCYCLMPNHFHFLIRIKSEAALRITFPKLAEDSQTLGKFLSKRFANLFSCYTQAFNKQQNRMGSLFIKNFKRKKIDDLSYLRNIIAYIHQNPVEANLCTKAQDWPHSSFKTLISDIPTFLKRSEIIEWYDDLENFIYCNKKTGSSNILNDDE